MASPGINGLPTVAVIIPAFNEASTIILLVEKVLCSPIVASTVLIDDGSTDGTGKMLADHPWPKNVTIVTHQTNLGKSRAIRTGLERVTADFVLIQDADLEYSPTDYPALLGPLVGGEADVVLGSRYLNATHPDAAWVFRMGVKALNLAIRALYGVRLTDEATCYKVVRTETLRKMNLQCERFEFCPEVIAKACRMGLRIVEVPISYHPRSVSEGKKIRLRDGVTALGTLWRWRKWKPAALPENLAACIIASAIVVSMTRSPATRGPNRETLRNLCH